MYCVYSEFIQSVNYVTSHCYLLEWNIIQDEYKTSKSNILQIPESTPE